MKSISSYISGMISFGLLCWILSKAGVYRTHYVTRAMEYERAMYFLKQPTCMDPQIKAELGDFNLCDRSIRIKYTHPWVNAVFDTAEDLRYCGHDVCSKYLPKVIIAVLIIATAVLMTVGCQMKQDRQTANREYFTLPLQGPTIHVHED
jgi:hypothetical protein